MSAMRCFSPALLLLAGSLSSATMSCSTSGAPPRDASLGAEGPSGLPSGTSADSRVSGSEDGRGQAARQVDLTDDREPDPSRALPKISTRHIGMHIGGESNTPEAKAPFLSALEKAEVDYLFCYRLVTRPMKGGTFGTDLYVGRRGGAPEVRAIRQRLGGEDFEGCMKAALSHVAFPAPARPTVLSYSLRFDVES